VAWRLCTSCSLLAAILPYFSGRLQLRVALRVDLLLPPRQHVLGRDVAGGAVQVDVVVVVNVTLHQTPRSIERQRRARPDGLPVERFVPPFDLSFGQVRRLRRMATVPTVL